LGPTGPGKYTRCSTFTWEKEFLGGSTRPLQILKQLVRGIDLTLTCHLNNRSRAVVRQITARVMTNPTTRSWSLSQSHEWYQSTYVYTYVAPPYGTQPCRACPRRGRVWSDTLTAGSEGASLWTRGCHVSLRDRKGWLSLGRIVAPANWFGEIGLDRVSGDG
jgi:hypothetical protein